MKFYEECRDCLLRSQISKISSERTGEEVDLFLDGCERICAERPGEYSAPLLVRDMDALYRSLFGKGIDYTGTKKVCDDAMLSLEDVISEKIESSPDTLCEAVKFAMAGNYIDFAHITSFDETSVSIIKDAAARAVPDPDVMGFLRNDLKGAESLVFLHDNCGEVVLDKILISVIRRLFPRVRVYSVVRGGDIINDVTLDDALACGLDEFSEIVPSGASIPGTYLKAINDRTRQLLQSADVIISKGLGNYETLCDEGMKIYYMFMCKCRHIAEKFNVRIHDTVLCLGI
ncbi:MAG: ARMT1-like domain-containing protein [Clostridia bacterium]|nr:ARMT1-like domain-containing protein [Clostridia bacterium]